MNRSNGAAAKLRGVYLLTPDAEANAFDRVARVVEDALREGVTAVQYRNKMASEAQREREAARVVALAHRFDAIAIVNDDPQLALRAGADGVHVGRSDVAPADARAFVGDRIVGVSCYADFALAETAVRSRSDCIAFGSVFPSSTKPLAAASPLSLLTQARERFESIRVVAIGGIDARNIGQVAAAGAHAAAVISAVFAAAEPRAAARQLIQGFLEGHARYESQRTSV